MLFPVMTYDTDSVDIRRGDINDDLDDVCWVANGVKAEEAVMILADRRRERRILELDLFIDSNFCTFVSSLIDVFWYYICFVSKRDGFPWNEIYYEFYRRCVCRSEKIWPFLVSWHHHLQICRRWRCLQQMKISFCVEFTWCYTGCIYQARGGRNIKEFEFYIGEWRTPLRSNLSHPQEKKGTFVWRITTPNILTIEMNAMVRRHRHAFEGGSESFHRTNNDADCWTSKRTVVM